MQDHDKGGDTPKPADPGSPDHGRPGHAFEASVRTTLMVADLRGFLPKPERPATVEEMNEAVEEKATASGE